MGLFNLAEMESTIRINESRIVILEQKVANQALEFQKLRQTEPMTINLKSQAAQQKETEALYAPLRSDTKPLIEMSAFLREISKVETTCLNDREAWILLRLLVLESRDILKRST